MTCNHRSCDPPTSALAGRHMRACGLARRQREMCLAVVRHHPGLTAREIEACIGIKAHKRLPELRADGQVRNGPARTCTVSDRQAMTWLPPEYVTNHRRFFHDDDPEHPSRAQAQPAAPADLRH